MTFVDFPIDYHLEVDNVSENLQNEIETRLLDLAADHTDMTGAAVAISAPGQTGDDRPIEYATRIIVYMRQKDVVGVKTDETVHGSVKGALEVVERQVREQRQKRNQTWKRADQAGAPGSATPLEADLELDEETVEKLDSLEQEAEEKRREE